MLSKKKTRWNMVVVLSCLMLVGFVSAGVAKELVETRYTIVELGTFGGWISRPSGINNYGQVIGNCGMRADILTPEDRDNDGVPDTWFADEDGDGNNDLMIDLGTLATNEGSDSPYVTAYGINDSGQVVGTSTTDEYYETSSGSKIYCRRVFLITPEDRIGDDGVPDTWFADDNDDGANDLMVNLGIMEFDSLSESMNSFAWSISNSGHVVGHVQKFGDLSSGHAFIIAPEDRDNDGVPDTWFADDDGDGYNDLMINLGLLDAEHYCSYAYGVNDSGQVVGWSGTRAYQAFLVTPEDVDGDGNLDWFNDAGDGSNALMIELEPLDGGVNSTACAINSSGQVVGWSKLTEASDARSYVVIWEADTTTPTRLLGDIRGYSNRATSINDLGQVVGYGASSHTSSMMSPNPHSITYTAFVWEDGALMTPLIKLIEEDIKVDDMTAMQINNLGQIVGTINLCGYIAIPITDGL